MLDLWENSLPFMPPAQGFRGFEAVKRIVTRRCLQWARVPLKYKMVQSGDPDAPVVKRIPVEWTFRCLKWAPYLAYAPTKRPGTRAAFSPYQPPSEGPRRYGKSKKIYREVEGGFSMFGFRPRWGLRMPQNPDCPTYPVRMHRGVGNFEAYPFCRKGGKLTSARRRSLPSHVFGLPEQRKYPMPDVSHARNAKARASMQYRRGALTRRQYARITSKADRIIRLCAGRSGRSFRTTRGFPKRVVRGRGMLTRRCTRFGTSRIGRRTCRKYRWVKVR